ncbi:MAG TPA: hypothetical protein PLR25_27240, partial [Planctomycetaceae bacterium]|nr:hypothetical protein [Planctomycetaceae bacterium]
CLRSDSLGDAISLVILFLPLALKPSNWRVAHIDQSDVYRRHVGCFANDCSTELIAGVFLTLV